MPDLAKLGLTKFRNVHITGAPDDIRLMLTELTQNPDVAAPYDLQLSFVFSLDEMKQTITDVAATHAVDPAGTLAIAYPKLASKRYVGIHRDDIFPFIDLNDQTGEVGRTGLKFSRMRSFDADFTLIDLRWLTQAPRKQSRSQRVGDYEAKLPELRTELPAAARAKWDTLTPGYRREWALYVYSPATAKTRAVHLAQMITALATGLNSVKAYQESKKR
ncbi:YdeI/OmpD-associated family protein [Lacticaseibacillus pabuli]|uniref:YdeI/OmpD-associated family protein n=1 Tax=Lacticaseibacillus pabuli TaxID=3025672 RepID=A0ABY7WRT8_9LACO|nr:YdeI/OmpD-associated family protein [Lacticaseibacillus sp. KACC 23028]WDF81727.1 YdeI/OmpD-associated family protein [Lacticaseibacillus sp. KACC 23028]